MASENLELVRGVYAAFARHEFPAEGFAEEVCWETTPDLPDAGVHRGIEAVRRFFADWVAGWHDVSNEVDELIDRGDRVVALVRGRFQLQPGSRPFERDYAHVWTVRDGKIVYVRSTDRSDPEVVG